MPASYGRKEMEVPLGEGKRNGILMGFVGTMERMNE